MDHSGAGPTIAQGAKTLGRRRTAFDAEVAAINAALQWHLSGHFRHMMVHSTRRVRLPARSAPEPAQASTSPGPSNGPLSSYIWKVVLQRSGGSEDM
jgi:hypothetical protein